VGNKGKLGRSLPKFTQNLRTSHLVYVLSKFYQKLGYQEKHNEILPIFSRILDLWNFGKIPKSPCSGEKYQKVFAVGSCSFGSPCKVLAVSEKYQKVLAVGSFSLFGKTYRISCNGYFGFSRMIYFTDSKFAERLRVKKNRIERARNVFSMVVA